jgi:hypothetical protein
MYYVFIILVWCGVDGEAINADGGLYQVRFH